jgi:hypothetical protein
MMAEPQSIAIIASREDVGTLTNCIRSVLLARHVGTAVIDVLVNGNEQLAHEVARVPFDCPANCQLRIWSIQQGDKAHAWNQYVHAIWPGRGNAVFLDGYVEVEPDALDALQQALSTSPAALAATGVPSSGRSAEWQRARMLREGGFQGNLHVLRSEVMQTVRTSGIRLPLGLYRTDSLTGALLLLGLDPAVHQWDNGRIAVAPGATWKVRQLERLTYSSLVSQWKRTLRQAQGELENRAVREHLVVKRLAPHLLAPTTHTLVNGWIAEQPKQARQLFRKRPLCAYAAWRLRTPRDWSAASLPPVKLADTRGAE